MDSNNLAFLYIDGRETASLERDPDKRQWFACKSTWTATPTPTQPADQAARAAQAIAWAPTQASLVEEVLHRQSQTHPMHLSHDEILTALGSKATTINPKHLKEVTERLNQAWSAIRQAKLGPGPTITTPEEKHTIDTLHAAATSYILTETDIHDILETRQRTATQAHNAYLHLQGLAFAVVATGDMTPSSFATLAGVARTTPARQWGVRP